MPSRRDRAGGSTCSSPTSEYSALGGLRPDPSFDAGSPTCSRTYETGVAKCVCCYRRMDRAERSNQQWDSQCSRQCGAQVQVQMCGPRDIAELLTLVGVPLVPIGVWQWLSMRW